MNTSSMIKVLVEINEFLQEQMWLDFEVMEYKKNRLTIIGSIDISTQHNIEIYFEEISFISLPMEWKTDTSEIVLTLLEGDKAITLNKKFQVEQGFHIFKFKPEDYTDDFGCYVGAKNISYKIIK